MIKSISVAITIGLLTYFYLYNENKKKESEHKVNLIIPFVVTIISGIITHTLINQELDDLSSSIKSFHDTPDSIKIDFSSVKSESIKEVIDSVSTGGFKLPEVPDVFINTSI